jgi:hypothetical protein
MTAPAVPPPAVSAAFPRGFVPVFSWGLAKVVRWKKTLLVGLAAAGLGYVIGEEGISADDPVGSLAEVLDAAGLTTALPLLALLLGAEGFSFEVHERTLVYHLVRPVSRTTLFVARFLAGWVPATLVAILFLASILVGSGVQLGVEVWLSIVPTATLAMLALTAIYYVLGALLKHGLVSGLVYTFVVEGFITNLPGSIQKLSVMHHVRSLHHRLTAEAFGRLGHEVAVGTDLEGPRGIGLGSPGTVEYDTLGGAVATLLGVAIVTLAYGAWRVRRTDYALKD